MNGCTFGDGKIGKAFIFDGVNDYVSLPNNSLNLTGDFSVSAWVYVPTTLNGNSSIRIISNISCDSWFSNPYGWEFLVYGNNLNFSIYNHTNVYYAIQVGYIFVQVSNVSPGGWYHLTATRKASTGTKLFINGNMVGSDSNTMNPTYNLTVDDIRPTIGNMYMGVNGSKQNSYYAPAGTKIDGLSVWQKELTQSEITELYNSGNGKQITTTPIVQSGLVLNLDASRSSSYTGTGTTWTDISGNGNNGTMTNGPVFGTASGGQITFDGINDYISLPDSSILQPSNITISTWFKLNQFSTNYVYGNANACVFRKGMYGYEISVRQDGKLLVFAYSDVNTQNQYLIDSISLNNWYNVVLTFGNSQMKVYINNVLVGTYSTNTNSIYYGGGGISIGRQGPWDMYYFNGNIGQTMVYNRALSATEITQNFNATKGRFGL